MAMQGFRFDGKLLFAGIGSVIAQTFKLLEQFLLTAR
jgi:hypothetical protein